MRKSKNEIEKTVGRSAGFVVSLTFFAAALFEKFLFFSRSSCELEQQKFASSPQWVKILKNVSIEFGQMRLSALSSGYFSTYPESEVVWKFLNTVSNSKCPEQKFKGSLLMVQNSLLIIIFCNSVVAEYWHKTFNSPLLTLQSLESFTLILITMPLTCKMHPFLSIWYSYVGLRTFIRFTVFDNDLQQSHFINSLIRN